MDRREFLRGAAVLAGSLALGWKSPAEAATKAHTTGASLAFWDGRRIVRASRIQASADSLNGRGARVIIHGHSVPAGQASCAIRGINAHFTAEQENSTISVPFHAWSASYHTSHKAAFTMPVDADRGLLFSVEHAGKTAAEERFTLSASGNTGDTALRPGTYIVAAGQPNWAGCRLIEDDGRQTLVRTALGAARPADFEYVLITVSEA
jgi:hypothetical protein